MSRKEVFIVFVTAFALFELLQMTPGPPSTQNKRNLYGITKRKEKQRLYMFHVILFFWLVLAHFLIANNKQSNVKCK